VPAGRVVKWEWFFSNVLTTGRLDDFSLKLCHTTRTALASTYADNYAGAAPVQVFYRARVDVTPRSNEWFGFDFDSSFPYDGARNLLVELRWKTGTETRAYTHSNAVGARFVVSYVENGTAKHGYPSAGLVRDEQHYMRLTVTAAAAPPTSLGRVKALFR
jgi:hypothetical protein